MEDEKNKSSSTPPSDFIGPRERISPAPESPTPADQPPQEEYPEPDSKPDKASDSTRWQRFRRWYAAHKKLSIPATVLATLLLIALIPFTRYAVAGVFISHDLQVQVLDTQTGDPVSEAAVSAGGASGVTSGNGRVSLRGVDVGPVTLNITKKYYKNSELAITVPVINPKKLYSAKLEATGRPVKIKTTDYVDGQAIAGAQITLADDVKAKTDKTGTALVVLPVGPHEHEAQIEKTGYNPVKATVTVSDSEIKQNDIKLTPAGKVYFLVARSGRMDVMKANLDGSEVQVALAGTGSERANGTTLIGSTDWKYVALMARRDGGRDKVFVLTTKDDKLTTADEGNAEFTIIGWSGDSLIYSIIRTDLKPWQTGAAKLKAYNADTGKITTLDQTTGTGDAASHTYEYYSFVYISGENIIYAKGWTSQTPESADLTGKEEKLASILASGQNHKVVAGYDAATKAVDYAPHGPSSIYILLTTQGTSQSVFYDYQVGSTPEQIELTLEEFYKGYPTYYPSPDGKKTAWSEVRDGKNILLSGSASGGTGVSVASLDDHLAFGWFSPRYLLVSRDSRELAIIGVSGGQPQTISSYSPSSHYFATPAGP